MPFLDSEPKVVTSFSPKCPRILCPLHPFTSQLPLSSGVARQWSMASAHLRKSIKVSLILSDGFDFGLGEVIKMWERGKRQEAYFYKQPILFKTISQPWARINLLWLFRWFRAMERCQEEETDLTGDLGMVYKAAVAPQARKTRVKSQGQVPPTARLLLRLSSRTTLISTTEECDMRLCMCK